MKDADDVYDLATLAVVHDEANAFDAVVPPIVQTSLFTFSSYAEMEEITGTKAVTLRSRMFHGLKRLARMIGGVDRGGNGTEGEKDEP